MNTTIRSHTQNIRTHEIKVAKAQEGYRKAVLYSYEALIEETQFKREVNSYCIALYKDFYPDTVKTPERSELERFLLSDCTVIELRTLVRYAIVRKRRWLELEAYLKALPIDLISGLDLYAYQSFHHLGQDNKVNNTCQIK